MIPPANETGGNETASTTRENPVALEVMVSVTGARPSGGSGPGELFSEDTVTVLVFKDGAVIWLSAGVAVGQLIFLTNKKSSEEVVCQVMHKRSYRPTVCYVELQFTEEKPGFWGAGYAAGKKSRSEFKVAEQVEAEETTEDDPGVEVARHSAEDVDQLKKEVEGLRKQLLGGEKKESGGRVVTGGIEKKPESTDKSVCATAKLELASVNDPSPEPVKAAEEVKTALAPVPTEKAEPEKRIIGMALPNRKVESVNPVEAAKRVAELAQAPAEEAKEPLEDLLPKPALDFSKMPASVVDLDENDPRSIYKPKSRGIAPEKVRVIGLGVVALLVVGGAWYGKWWRYLPGRKKAVAGTVVRPATENPKSRQDAGATKGGAAGNLGASESSGAKAQGVGAAMSDLKVRPPEEDPKSRTFDGQGKPFEAQGKQDALRESGQGGTTKGGAGANLGASESAGAKAQGPEAAMSDLKVRPPEVREKVVRKTTPEKNVETAAGRKMTPKKNVEAAATGEAAAVAPVASDAPMTPAKLLRAANPVYPPNAMRNYITGDIRAEVVVEASGRVGEVKVISGPQALRAAAVEALRKYEYAPGTQEGKAVATRVVATVKFWFNP